MDASIFLAPSAIFGFGLSIAAFAAHFGPKLPEGQRKALSQFILQTDVSRTRNALVSSSIALMNLIFGRRHFTVRCFVTSATISIVAILLFYFCSIVLSRKLALASGQLWDQTNINYRYWVHLWDGPFSGGFYLWIFWNVIIDFFSVWKTRFLLRVLNSRYRGLAELALFLVADFVLGYAIFISAFVTFVLVTYHVLNLPPIVPTGGFEATLLTSWLLWYHQIPASFNPPMIWPYFFFALVPFATAMSDFFYASIVPSIWLWLYFFAAIFARFAYPIGKVLAVFRKYFDVEKYPLEFIGDVAAAAVISIALTMFLFSIII